MSSMSAASVTPRWAISASTAASSRRHHYPALAWQCRAGVLCNDASLRRGRWPVAGGRRPHRGRAARAGRQGRLHPHAGARCLAAIVPSPSSRNTVSWPRCTATDGAPWIFVKGAPERILDMCCFAAGPRWRASCRSMSTTGAAWPPTRPRRACVCSRWPANAGPERERLRFERPGRGYTSCWPGRHHRPAARGGDRGRPSATTPASA
jgi:hypothetical protein